MNLKKNKSKENKELYIFSFSLYLSPTPFSLYCHIFYLCAQLLIFLLELVNSLLNKGLKFAHIFTFFTAFSFFCLSGLSSGINFLHPEKLL